jgi:hypothetical protein
MILIINIFNCLLVKNIEIWYFEIHRNKSNKILYDNIDIYILLENTVKTRYMNNAFSKNGVYNMRRR